MISKYEGIHASAGKQELPPEKQYGLIFSFPGAGKSHFFESNPNAFIFNMDLTSTSNPEPTATTFPVFNESGIPIDGTGQPFALKWPKILEVIDQLLRLAEQDKPRPETIVFDSLSTMIPLIKEWTPNGLPFPSMHGKTFQELDGKMAYDFLYNTITSTALKLRQAGYGVWILAHVFNKEIKDKNGNVIDTKVRPSISESLWNRLVPQFEVVATITKGVEMIEHEKIETVPGRRTPRKTITNERVTTHTFGFSVKDLKDYYKARAYPEVVLPAIGGWEAFRSAYLDALRTSQTEALQKDNDE